MTTLLVAFDLEGADADDYALGYTALAQVGLFRCSPNKQLRLPDSTVLGDAELSGDAASIRDTLKSRLANATGRKVTRLAVGVVTDWATTGDEDRLASLGGLLAYITARS